MDYVTTVYLKHEDSPDTMVLHLVERVEEGEDVSRHKLAERAERRALKQTCSHWQHKFTAQPRQTDVTEDLPIPE